MVDKTDLSRYKPDTSINNMAFFRFRIPIWTTVMMKTPMKYVLLLVTMTILATIYWTLLNRKSESTRKLSGLHNSQVLDGSEYKVESVKLLLNNKTGSNWKSKEFCVVNCKSGVPCEYKDEVDFRIILIVANRPDSLKKCLLHIMQIDMMGDKLAVDIWIDMLKDGTIHEGTRKVAEEFSNTFTNGRGCYHTQDHHSFITNQWINTYRPKRGTKEVAMILEDDIDVSKHVWRWYKSLHTDFGSVDHIAGYSLKMKNANLRVVGKMNVPIKGPKNHTIVLYNCFEAWGYSPRPSVWRDFQDWYYKVRTNKNKNDIVNKVDSLVPEVPGAKHYQWWLSYKKKDFQESMAHEIWNIYYTNIIRKDLYTVYSNLKTFTGRDDQKLCVNREEKGLHYNGSTKLVNSASQLLNNWDSRYVEFPSDPYRLSITGERLT